MSGAGASYFEKPRLAESLSSITPWQNESRRHYLGRLQAVSAFYGDQVLEPDQFDVLRTPLPRWSVTQVNSPATLVIAERPIDFNAKPKVDGFNTDRRQITASMPRVAMLAETALLGEDLHTLFTLESKLETGSLRAQRRASAGSEPELTEPELKLTDRERQIIALYAKHGQFTVKAISEELGIAAVTVSRLVGNAIARNGMDRARFFVRAWSENLIDLTYLPDAPDASLGALTPRQRQIAGHALRPDEETAALLGISTPTVWRHWHRIFEKLEGLSRLQIYCMMKRYASSKPDR